MKFLRSLPSVILVLSAFVLCVQLIDYINFTVDDAFIPLRIVRNAASGFGFVYNRGEFVEGHSDPLWVFILTPVQLLLGNNGNPMTMLWIEKLFSIVFGLLCIVAIYATASELTKESSNNKLVSSLVVLSVASCGHFVLWMDGGLETSLTALFYSLAFYQCTRLLSGKHSNSVLSSVLLCLSVIGASLCRPEAPMIAVFILAFVFFHSGNRTQFLLSCIVPFLTVMMLFASWRFSTYSDVFPNTYYAKTGGGFREAINGLRYTFASLAAVTGPLLLVTPLQFIKKFRILRVHALAAGIVLCNVIFVVFAGGDWMPGFRFMVPLAPIMLMTTVLSACKAYESVDIHFTKITSHVFAVASIVIIAFSASFYARTLIRGQAPSMRSGFGRIIGHSLPAYADVSSWLSEHIKPNALVAMGEAGLIGYLNPDMRLLDLNGLMDRKIAYNIKNHKPWDTDYIFQRNPDFVVMYTDLAKPNGEFFQHSDYYTAIYNDERFVNRYALAANIEMFSIYQRKDLVAGK